MPCAPPRDAVAAPRLLAALALVLAVSSPGGLRANPEEKATGSAERAAGLDLREIPFTRWLPHGYLDQAISSIASMHPEAVILARRRSGALGDLRYSLVGYMAEASSRQVVITGCVTAAKRAWTFETSAPREEFGDALLRVMERLARGPEG